MEKFLREDLKKEIIILSNKLGQSQMKDLREKETFAFYLLLYAHVLAQLLSHRAFKAELNEFLKIVEQIMKHVKGL